MNRIITIILVLVAALAVAACNVEGNGYATAQEGCDAEGSGKIVKGPIKEKDEVEFYCELRPGSNVAVVIEQARGDAQDNVKNSWYADEDNYMDLSTGQEISREQFDPEDYLESGE